MIAFADLLERLVFTPGRNAKIALLRRFFATEPDPDRGIGLAAVTGELAFAAAKPGLIRELAAARTDPELFAWSYDYVGDLAETVALMWPADPAERAAAHARRGGAHARRDARRRRCPRIVAGWLDASDASVRFALLKLITGGLRVGVSARLAKLALAEMTGGPHRARTTSRRSGTAWRRPTCRCSPGWRARGPRPDPADAPIFRPPMLAHPLGAGGPRRARSRRAAAPSGNGTASACSSSPPPAAGGCTRAAPTTSPRAFPEIIEAMDFHAVLDGELLVMRDGVVAPFAELQQRLNRKTRDGEDAARLPGRRAALRHAVRRRARTSARCPSTPAARGWRTGIARARPARMDLSRDDPVRHARRPRRVCATARGPPRSRG